MMYLYHIFKEEDYGDLFKGYIGISKTPEARIDRHFAGHGNVVVQRAFDKYGELCFSVITQGSEEEIKRLEKYLRPSPRIAWNIAEGGGLPPDMTGRDMPDEHKAKISEANKKWQRARKKEVWVCEGIEFISKLEASEHFGVTRKTIKDRCDNPKFVNWYRGMK